MIRGSSQNNRRFKRQLRYKRDQLILTEIMDAICDPCSFPTRGTYRKRFATKRIGRTQGDFPQLPTCINGQAKEVHLSWFSLDDVGNWRAKRSKDAVNKRSPTTQNQMFTNEVSLASKTNSYFKKHTLNSYKTEEKNRHSFKILWGKIKV